MMKNHVIFVVFALVSMVLGSSAWAQATSPCLAVPTAAAEFWSDQLTPPNNTGGTYGNPEEDCPRVCKKWVRTCKGISDTAEHCILRSFYNLTKLSAAECKTIDDETAKKACIKGLREQAEEFHELVETDAQAANEACRGEFENCVSACVSATGGS